MIVIHIKATIKYLIFNNKSNGKEIQSIGQTFEDVGLIYSVEGSQNIQTDGCKLHFKSPNFSHVTQFCSQLLKSQFCFAILTTSAAAGPIFRVKKVLHVSYLQLAELGWNELVAKCSKNKGCIQLIYVTSP